MRVAGILIPLFSIRSRGDLGRGEIYGLEPMIDFAVAAGHRMIQLLPLDETAPGEKSPYSAMSVFAIDPMYISASGLAGIGASVLGRARAAAFATARAPAREAVRREKLELLTRAWRAAHPRGGRGKDPAFRKFAAANRDWLDEYALFRALKERFDWTAWEAWPEEIARRDPKALNAARRKLAGEIDKYRFWQFIADRQWSEVRGYAHERGASIGGDLAFSPGRDSAEVWANQDDFDLNRSVGAPPDGFNPKGQRWGLPLPKWEKMRESGLKLMRARVRRAAQLYDFIRIDHVVGLYRTFNFGPDPETGGEFTPWREEDEYAQGEEILKTIQSEAGGAVLIAEDLGTVPPWVRESLARLGIPGYKVMRWERVNWGAWDETYSSPSSYPELSLATTGTHDMEPITIWWRDLPVHEREKLVGAFGLHNRVSAKEMLSHTSREALLEALFASPSELVIIPFQDLFGWCAQINRPGTVADSNWTWRLPLDIDRLRHCGAIRAQVARLHAIAMRSGRI
ncbi:MAG TPA: 4-alpha-glucanotransferase [Candidatus Binataceae bacterium]|nr:4-alpha-glucanotransferase [Candidatus Binataceae bacterium]